MRQNKYGGFRFIFSFLAILLSLWACAPAPTYPGHPQEPTNLTKVEQGGVSLALPPGWKSVPVSGKDPIDKAKFEKQGTSLTLTIMCNSLYLTPEAQGNMLRTAAEKSMKNIQLIRGPYALGSSRHATIFEAYGENSPSSDKPVVMYVAYNIERVFSGCMYNVILVGTKQDAADIEPEFVAIVRSL